MLHLVRLHLAESLAIVERHIVQTEMNITRQRDRVVGLEGSDEDCALSQSLLDNFETALRMHYRHRNTVLREMAE
jgi:hypothetical protein